MYLQKIYSLNRLNFLIGNECFIFTKHSNTMTRRISFYFSLLFFSMYFTGHAQGLLFYQAQFNGGVTTGGYSPDYSNGGTGNFSLSIAPGSTIYKAYLMAGRHGNAAPLTVTLNGSAVTFDNSNQVSPTFQSSNYGGNSGVHAADVTSIINPAVNAYTLVIPFESGPADRFNDFYLYVAYANNSLQQVSTAIFINTADVQSSVTYPLTMPYAFSTSTNVALSMFDGYICNNTGDGEIITANGTNLGTIGNPDFNSGACGGPIGSFAYQNGTLTGLGDDVADQAMNGSDALSNIQSLVTNCSTALTVNCAHQGGSSDNAIWALIFAYGSGSSNFSLGPDTTVCTGQPVQLSAPSGGTISWTPTAGLSCTNCSNPVATPSITTTYIATITGASCGNGSDTITIFIANNPTLTVAGNDTTVCAGSAVQLNAVANGNITWNPSTGLSCNNCANPVATPLVTTKYVATTGGGGCTANDSITITVVSSPVITVSNDTSVCTGNSAQLSAVSNAPVTWSPSNSLSCSGCNNPVAQPAATTMYYATAGTSSCSVTDSVLVTITSPPSLSISNDTSICSGSSAQLNAVSAASVVWNPSANLSCSVCNNPLASPPSTTTFYAIAGSAGCVTTDSLVVTVLNYPTLTLSADTAVCPNSPVNLNAISNGNIVWSPSANLSCTICNSPTAVVANTTTFYATANNSSCIVTDSVTITISNALVLSAGSDTGICKGDTIRLNATANAAVTWNSSSTLSCSDCNNPLAFPQQNTFYVALASSNGCTVSDSIFVTVDSSRVQANENDSIYSGETIFLHAANADSVEWVPAGSLINPKSFNPEAGPLVTTLYHVYGYKNGCRSVDSVWVFVKEPCGNLLLPSAFSPNNDGVNDKLRILNKNFSKLNWFRVYNRWGELVFEASDFLDAWDGTYKDKNQPMGVYAFSVSFVCSGKTYETQGNVTLVR
jgi:gliding motility-associated-like protein